MQAKTLQFLRETAPAALATEPRKGLSNRYTFFSTRELLGALETENWRVVETKQSKSRSGPLAAKHQLIVADKDVARERGIGEYPRVILTNQHDGDGACKVSAGYWRMLCSNGMEVSEGLIQSVRVPHTRHTVEEIIAAAQYLRENAPRLGE